MCRTDMYEATASTPRAGLISDEDQHEGHTTNEEDYLTLYRMLAIRGGPDDLEYARELYRIELAENGGAL